MRNGSQRKANGIRRLEDPFPYPVPGFEDGWLTPYRENWSPLIAGAPTA